MICLFDGSAWMPCTTGKENFPSVRSSAKPLLDVYYGRMLVSASHLEEELSRPMPPTRSLSITHLFTGEVHQVIAYLEIHAEEADEGDEVAVIRT